MKKNDFEDFDLIGGKLYDPKSGINTISNLYIRNGKIFHKPPKGKPSRNAFAITNEIVLPGLLDLRAHNRVPGAAKSESIETLTLAAAKGGFTSILAMPNTNPFSDNPATIRYIQDRIQQTAKIKVYLSACLTAESKGESIAPLGSLKDAGVIAVTDCPTTPTNNQIFINAIRYAKMFGLKVIDFPQDTYLSKNTHAHESPLSLKMGLAGCPRIAEEIAVQRAILISKHLSVPIHLSSISSVGSIPLIAQAKESGVQITADVSAHHLLLTEQEICNYSTNAKTNPPLRHEDDRQALLKGIKTGEIDACNSSHEPYAQHHKDVEFDLAPMGSIGLETAALCFIEAIKENDPFPLLLEKMCYNPHTILGLSPTSLKEGSDANFVVVKPNHSWVYDPSSGESLCRNSPLKDYSFSNKITMTVSNGRIACNSHHSS